MKISETIAVVTGGASGLGEATVRKFAEGGAKVAIFDMNASKGEAVAAELGDHVIFQRVDVTDEASVKAGLDAAVEAFGGVTACINCAGLGVAMKTMGKEGPHSLDLYKKVIEVNLIVTFNTLRLTVERMSANEPNEEGE
ncbi:MAG: SDR family NAD(P)-dependent oxidoreductase, partial [Hoeflea sp.]